MYKVRIFIILYSITFFNCESQQDVNKTILECFERKIDNHNTFYTSEELLESFKGFDKFLLENNILEGSTKKDYLRIINNVIVDKDFYENYNSTIKSLKINDFFTSNVLHDYKMCVYDLLSQNKKSTYLDDYLFSIDKLEASGFNDLNSLKEFIELTKLDNEKSRLIVSGWIFACIFDSDN